MSGSSAVVPNRPQQVRSFKKERRKPRKKVLAVAVASSFATLIVVCAVILFVTGGKGTDIFWRDAVNKSQSIKSDTEKLTGQLEEKKDSTSQKEVPSEGSTSAPATSSQGQAAGQEASSGPSASLDQKPDSASAQSAPAQPSSSYPAAKDTATPQPQQASSSSSSSYGGSQSQKEEKGKKTEAAQNPSNSALVGKASSPDSTSSGPKN
ncbi:MAG: hypothetical protein J6P35_00385 [Aeriscardovia sp.]|nr:hypothetical protein [Aeriscardovia sp.]